eukprot:712357-Ditylum_brightwellii.AAC.1
MGNSIDKLLLSGKTYVTGICEKVELLMGWTLKGFNNPIDPHYHAEIDESDFVVGKDISKHRMMVGRINWLITLGRCDIYFPTTTLARHMMMPRQGHMHAMKHVLGYLRQNPYFSINFNANEPGFSGYNVEQYDWFPLYGNVQEEMTFDRPEPKGKAVVTSGFFDSSHTSCLVTRRSTTCVLMFPNKTPIRWYSKRQNCIETSTYGFEIVAGRTTVDMAVKLRYNLRMLGAPVKGTNTSLPHSMSKKCQSANNYH